MMNEYVFTESEQYRYDRLYPLIQRYKHMWNQAEAHRRRELEQAPVTWMCDVDVRLKRSGQQKNMFAETVTWVSAVFPTVAQCVLALEAGTFRHSTHCAVLHNHRCGGRVSGQLVKNLRGLFAHISADDIRLGTHDLLPVPKTNGSATPDVTITTRARMVEIVAELQQLLAQDDGHVPHP